MIVKHCKYNICCNLEGEGRREAGPETEATTRRRRGATIAGYARKHASTNVLYLLKITQSLSLSFCLRPSRYTFEKITFVNLSQCFLTLPSPLNHYMNNLLAMLFHEQLGPCFIILKVFLHQEASP